MTKLMVLFAALMIAACSHHGNSQQQSKGEFAALAESPPIDPSLWTSADEAEGSYSVLFDDGTEGVVHLGADGVSRAIIGGEEYITAFTVTAPGTLCYRRLGGEAGLASQCWVNSRMRDDGSWTRTGELGSTAIMKHID